jgi:hypothetical protein
VKILEFIGNEFANLRSASKSPESGTFDSTRLDLRWFELSPLDESTMSPPPEPAVCSSGKRPTVLNGTTNGGMRRLLWRS